MLLPTEELQESVLKELLKLEEGDLFDTGSTAYIFVDHSDVPGIEVVIAIDKKNCHAIVQDEYISLTTVDFRAAICFNKH